MNTLHAVVEGDGILPDPSPQAVADEVKANLAGDYRAILGENWSLDSIDVHTVTDPNEPDEVPSAGSAPVGLTGTRTLSNVHVPPRIGGLIVWKTGNVGRSFRGRFFVRGATRWPR